MAIVLPAPGGPVTVVIGPRAPSAMSFSMRGRGTAQPGRPGMVILDINTGSSLPVACALERAGPRAAVLVTFAINSPGLRPPTSRCGTFILRVMACSARGPEAAGQLGSTV